MFIIVFIFFFLFGHSQNQRVADSLIQKHEQSNLSDGQLLEMLHGIASNHTIAEQIINYSLRLIAASNDQNDQYWLHKGLMELGSGYRLKGDLDLALKTYFNSNEAAKNADYVEGEGASLSMIADIYSINGNSRVAIQYYDQAIDILSKTNDSLKYATVLLNAGDEYVNSADYEKALIYFEKSGAIFQNIGSLMGKGYNLGNSGMAHAKLGHHSLAEENINQAIQILESLEDYYPISVYLTYLSDIYIERGDHDSALKYAERSLHIAEKYNLKDQISETNLQLSKLYENADNIDLAFEYYKNHIAYRDSVTNLEKVQEMAGLRTDFEVSQKQIEVDLLNQEKKNQSIIVFATIAVSFLLSLLALGLYRRYKFTKKTKNIIEKERNRSDSLLLNILPKETAEELKLHGKVQAKKFDSVTVMFTDFKGFTRCAERLTPEDLVSAVDFYFSKFDKIIGNYGLEKIKTVGDAYMCAGGLPFPSKDHAINMVKAAIDIAEFVETSKISDNMSNSRFDIRIGINTGPVVAGVVGSKKFAYDIWGDTVNIASRMESNSDVGEINISENTYQLIKDRFECKYRGELSVKNRGKLPMYFVKR